MTSPAPEALGRLVRETWVAWAKEQPDPKPSWLIEWPDLDAAQREVDIRIGRALVAAERERAGLCTSCPARYDRESGTVEHEDDCRWLAMVRSEHDCGRSGFCGHPSHQSSQDRSTP